MSNSPSAVRRRSFKLHKAILGASLALSAFALAPSAARAQITQINAATTAGTTNVLTGGTSSTGGGGANANATVVNAGQTGNAIVLNRAAVSITFAGATTMNLGVAGAGGAVGFASLDLNAGPTGGIGGAAVTAGNLTLQNNAAGGTVAIAFPIINSQAGAQTVTFDSGAVATNIFTLSGNNTYTGNTIINADDNLFVQLTGTNASLAYTVGAGAGLRGAG